MVSKGKEGGVTNIADLETRIQELKYRADYIRETAAELFATISEVLEPGEERVSRDSHDVPHRKAGGNTQATQRATLSLVD